jgi:cobalamin biosynthesis Mg chelatase CobN
LSRLFIAVFNTSEKCGVVICVGCGCAILKSIVYSLISEYMGFFSKLFGKDDAPAEQAKESAQSALDSAAEATEHAATAVEKAAGDVADTASSTTANVAGEVADTAESVESDFEGKSST